MSTRHIARTVAVASCPTAVHAAVQGIDLEQLVEGTPFCDRARMPASARQRGIRFEQLLAEDGYARAREVLAAHLGYQTIAAGAVRDLRRGFPDGSKGLALRARETARLLREMAAGGRGTPLILAGAVLTYRLGDHLRYVEADLIVRRPDGRLLVVEAKAHPVVDGLVVGGPQTGWRLQIGLYANAVADLLGVGGYPDVVASEALLILPEGQGLKQPTIRALRVGDDRIAAALVLERLGAAR